MIAAQHAFPLTVSAETFMLMLPTAPFFIRSDEKRTPPAIPISMRPKHRTQVVVRACAGIKTRSRRA